MERGGNDKVAKGGEDGSRNDGRWLSGPKDSGGGNRTYDRWGGGRRNEGEERDNGRRWIGGEAIFVNVLTFSQGLWDLLGNFWVYPRNIGDFGIYISLTISLGDERDGMRKRIGGDGKVIKVLGFGF